MSKAKNKKLKPRKLPKWSAEGEGARHWLDNLPKGVVCQNCGRYVPLSFGKKKMESCPHCGWGQ